MTPGMQMLVAVLSTGAATKIIDEIIRAIKRASDKKKNRGIGQMEKDVAEMRRDISGFSKDMNDLKEVDRVILHDRIWSAYDKLQNSDSITIKDKSNLDYLYGEYKRLHGNHKAEIMYNEINKKPVRGND